MKQLLPLLLSLFALTAQAQREMYVHTTSQGTAWQFPYAVDGLDGLVVDGLTTASGQTITFASLDSLTFALIDTVETHDHYTVCRLRIDTEDGAEVDSRDTYVPAYLSLDARHAYANRDLAAQIRQRGNSSRLWYDKKPYRLKLAKKQKMLGLAKAKSWVLLANYRDVTDLMNTFVFEVARAMGLPFTNHTRYVELFLGDEYLGLYQLTEQIQQGESRVDISPERGILLSLDVDDGPDQAPDAPDNFWTQVYSMPACVKYPEDGAKRDSVKAVFAELEAAIKAGDYALTDSLMDLRSMVHYLQVQELVENVELVAPRSVFLYKDSTARWTAGPVWDFDAGYDFDWSEMTTGHTYFADYRELVLGSDPLHRNGYDANIPAFFTDLFALPQFVALYKEEWAGMKDTLLTHAWGEMERYLDALRQGPMAREAARWPLRAGRRTYDFETEVAKMKTWLERRVSYLNGIIAAYPTPTAVPTTHVACGNLSVSATLLRALGYSQYNTVDISEDDVCRLLGLATWQFDSTKVRFVPLDAAGREGENHTNGTYGGWFDHDGTPLTWATGHTYIEIYDDPFHWQCGLHPDNCTACTQHQNTMQLQYTDGTTTKTVDIHVTFEIQ